MAKKINITTAVNFYEKSYKDNWGYVWGGRGKKYTIDEAKYLLRTFKSKKYNEEYFLKTQMNRWGGHNVADCSGLNEALCGLNITADAYYKKCTKTGSINSIPNEPGILVFVDKGGKKNHIGMTVGKGFVIESLSSSTGVVKRKLTSTNKWTHWGIPHYIERTFTDPKVTAITKNSSAIDICWLQWKLNIVLKNTKGFIPLAVDGSYGPITQRAVIRYWTMLRWNIASGLKVGSSTINALKKNRTK